MDEIRVWFKLENLHNCTSVHVLATALIDDVIVAGLEKERKTDISPGNVTKYWWKRVEEKSLCF